MKKYIKPEINIAVLSNIDIITTSGLANSKTTLSDYTRGSKTASMSSLGLNS